VTAASTDGPAKATAPAPKPAKQRTIAREATLAGVGFFSGRDVSLRLIPAEPNHGFVFIRVDLPGSPAIPALVRHRVPEPRRTALQVGDARVEMSEHVLAALVGMGVDNCRIELNGPEPPGLDGSALAYVEAIGSGGLEVQAPPRLPIVIEEPVHAADGDAFAAAHPGPPGRFDVTYNLDYSDNPGIGKQSLCYSHTPEAFAREIAPARTFIREKEVEWLRGQGIGKRTTTRDLLVFADDGSVRDNRLRFPDEPVRHKILDLIGDLALVGRPVMGHILAHRSGHATNAALAAALVGHEEERAIARHRSAKPLLDSAQIEQIMPHRYPFLLLDRVVELDPNRKAVGIKNVTYNEPFFQGHWPGRPVMPGVLIVEAMAQLAGVMLTQWQEDGRYAMIVGMDGIKLRRPVTPGDQLRLEAETVRLKSRTAVLKTRAWVEHDLAAEAELRLVLVNEGASPAADA
jgi:UDP-3-O-[3-hydroxymyristoyl] N-acetylglucosamine deacetylase/3-hydroxyacyl-[acyl-carrier-protein] dehydratase